MNKKSITLSVGDVIKQKSLFQKDKLILIDEVDGVSGTKDRGGVAELTKIVKASNYPICFTANDKDSDKTERAVSKCDDFGHTACTGKDADFLSDQHVEKHER